MTERPALPAAVAAAVAAGLTEEGVRTVRHAVYEDGAICLADADMLFAVLAAVGDGHCPQWPELFAEAMADIMVDEVEPHGYVSKANADWLIGRMRGDDRVLRSTEFGALIAVIEKARSIPDALAAFALGLVHDAIVSGNGLLGPAGVQGTVTAADTAALRTILHAASSEGFGFITRAEAEALFAIADATAGRDNDPGFDDLFARAVGNHLIAAGGRHPPTVNEALHRERWLDQRQTTAQGVGRFFARSLSAVISGDAFTACTGGWVADRAADGFMQNAVQAISEGEARWVVERITRDGTVSSAETRLLAFIRDDGAPVPAVMRPLIERIAA